MSRDIKHQIRMSGQLFKNLMLKASETRNPFKKLYFWFLAGRVLWTLQRFESFLTKR